MFCFALLCLLTPCAFVSSRHRGYEAYISVDRAAQNPAGCSFLLRHPGMGLNSSSQLTYSHSGLNVFLGRVLIWETCALITL